MLSTVLEILVFMIIAAILGVLLGWLLRGALGSEQAEVSRLGTKVRNLKKQLREKDTATKAERVSTATTTTTSSLSKPAQADLPKAVTAKKSSSVKKPIAAKTAAVKKSPAKKSITAKKPSVRKPAAVKAVKKAPSTAKSTPVKASKSKPAAQMSKSEKTAKQRAAKKEVVGIVSRIGKGESKDDLSKIYGIGPKFSAMLNKMGIRSYAQIAKLRKADVRTISSAIGVFSDRIERDDWVAGAKKALKAKK